MQPLSPPVNEHLMELLMMLDIARAAAANEVHAIKERLSDTEVRIGQVIGPRLRGHHRALVYDDEIATGSTIVEISRLLIDQGIAEIWVVCTHGVFVREAEDGLRRELFGNWI